MMATNVAVFPSSAIHSGSRHHRRSHHYHRRPDALLEDLQAVVPRSDRPPANGTPNAGNRPPASQNNGYSPALNSNSSDTYGGGGNSLSAPTTTSNMSGNGGSKMISPITQASSNLAELDSLLESLNSPSLGMDLDDEGEEFGELYLRNNFYSVFFFSLCKPDITCCKLSNWLGENNFWHTLSILSETFRCLPFSP